jgi:hypothetical protein
LLTNLREKEDPEKPHQMGVYSYLVKSNWKLQDVVDTVKQTLSGPALENRWSL